jgi:AcrR family transcriptional regulator
LPTGTALQHAREQLFDAAERVLLRDGPATLTSRAVTAEAGVAKGVLHRYFEDFDAFLAELTEDRIARLGHQGAVLRDRAGTGTVIGNLAGALTELFSSVVVAIIPLITFRDELRARLRQARPGGGAPVLAEAAAMLAGYLAAEQQAGRITAGADVGALAPALLGAEHLLFAGREGGGPPSPQAVRKAVAVVMSGVLRDPVP